MIPSFGNFTMLRTLRALRPLRTLRFVPGMPTLISSIFKSIPPLGSVAGLCAFLFLIFGIVGEELFEGSLHWYCIKPSELWALEHGGHHRLLKGGGGGGEKVPFCRAGDASLCHEGEICHYFEDNPPGQSAHFDSVIAAAMAIIQVITFDTWSNVMYDLMRAFSNYVWVYFFLVAMLGGFFVVNLFLAVVFDEFMRSKVRRYRPFTPSAAPVPPTIPIASELTHGAKALDVRHTNASHEAPHRSMQAKAGCTRWHNLYASPVGLSLS